MDGRIHSCLLLALYVCLSSSQYITEHPSSQAVKSDANVTLRCGALNPTFTQWLKAQPDGPPQLLDASLDDRITVTTVSGGSELRISKFHAMDHAGLYSCLFGLGGGTGVHTCPANVSHARIKAGFQEHPVDTTATVGSTALLQCQAEQSNPAPIITWEKDRELLTSDGAHVIILPSGNLYIVGVKPGDAGLYRCIATNSVTSTARHSMEAELVVAARNTNDTASHASPTITFHSLDVAVTIGNEAYVECFAEGVPQPTVSWTFLEADTSFFSFLQQSPSLSTLPSGTLWLQSVKQSDAGRYECLAENSYGRIQAIVNVRVLEPPHVTVSMSSAIVTAGNPLTLSCMVEGNDHVTVMWFKDPVVLDYRIDVPSPETFPITIPEASPSDGGLYQCMAYNHLGCSYALIDVTVYDGPVITEPSPTPVPRVPITVEITPSELDLSQETDNQLSCFVTGSPTPVVSWMRLDQGSVGEATTFDFNNDQISFLTVDSDGLYICQASNEFETELAMATVTMGTGTPPPSPSPSIQDLLPLFSSETTPTETTPVSSSEGTPTSSSEITPISSTATAPTSSSTTLLQATPTPSVSPVLPLPPLIYPVPESLVVHLGASANLTCVINGAPPLSIIWETLGGSVLEGVSIYSLSDDVTVTHVELKPVVAEYNGFITCQAKWSDGLELTTGVAVTVKPSPPTRKPLFLDVWWQENGRVSITWIRLDSNLEPSPILGYKLNWEPSGTHVSQSAIAYVAENKWTFLTGHLNTYSGYTFELRAYSAGGDGPASTFDLPPYYTDPTPPTISLTSCDTVSPTSAFLQWKVSGDHSAVDNHQLVYTCEEANVSHVVPVSRSPSPNDLELTGLLPNCNYTFRIVGVGADGTTVLTSQDCKNDTPNGQIDVNFEVERLPDGSVRLTWTLGDVLKDENAKVSVDWGEGWVEVTGAMYVIFHEEAREADSVRLQVTIGDYSASVSTPLPPLLPSPTPEGQEMEKLNQDENDNSSTEVVLLYTTIFGTLLVACGIVVIVILVLKYIQMNRRNTDKVLNDREKSREEFKRMSLSRSSTASIKKPSFPSKTKPLQNGVCV